MTQLQLEQPRDITGLFRDSLGVYFRNAGVFVALSAAVVAPVHLVVEGIGLEMLTGPYDDSPTLSEAAVPTVVDFLVVSPIVTAICIFALRSVAAGQRIGARQAFISGFEAFTPLFLAVAIAAVGIAIGFVLLIVPGIYLLVRLFFVPQAVVIEGARGLDALRASSRVVEGFWWRTFGLVILVNLAVAVPGLVLQAPFAALASSSGDAVWELAGTILVTSLAAPFVALYATLLYHDLIARRSSTY